MHIAGQFRPDDETFHGTFRFPDNPKVAEELCAALTGWVAIRRFDLGNAGRGEVTHPGRESRCLCWPILP